MMCGLPSPQYVSAVTFQNQSGKDVNVEVSFKSGHSENYTSGNQPVEVQRIIDHGGFTSVDPIQSFNVHFGQGQVVNVGCQDLVTVQKRTYVIHPNNLVQRKTQ